MNTTYCTIVAQNYLPQALALYASVQACEPGRPFCLLVIDADRRALESAHPGLTVVRVEDLGLSAREFDELAAIYDIVELSTAVKPLLLKRLLGQFSRAVYLDPDMYVVSALSELDALIDLHGVVLTPHFLRPIPPGSSYISEVHSLTVGVHNLGFCAVGQGASVFLDWWWGHLRRECLIYPLLGLFVDQKWTDIGANLFHSHSLQHYGYNVGPWNLGERPVRLTEDGLIAGDSDPLRLVHFSGFDARDPDAISVRLNSDLKSTGAATPAFAELSRQYASSVLVAQAELGSAPIYRFAVDSSGKPLTKRVRRAYRAALLEGESSRPPSPFGVADRKAFATWRRRSIQSRAMIAFSDLAIAAKYALPDEYARFKKSTPMGFQAMRSTLLSAAKVRR